MIEDDRPNDGSLERMYRMPTAFGPAPGPRNVPREEQARRYVNARTMLTVEASTDVECLRRLLPQSCYLHGDPIVRVSVSWLRNLGWLAGRGYNILTVQIPNVVFAGQDGDIHGDFIPVMWESLCDPIITGREEIAFPKIWAEIPEARVLSGSWHASAYWLSYPFFDLTADRMEDAAMPPPAAKPVLTRKYIPKTGEWGVPDADYMTVTSPDRQQPAAKIDQHCLGRGSFAFRRARWEDMPTQYQITNTLADLPLSSFLGARLVSSSQGEVLTTGGGNFSGQRIIDPREKT